MKREQTGGHSGKFLSFIVDSRKNPMHKMVACVWFAFWSILGQVQLDLQEILGPVPLAVHLEALSFRLEGY